MKRRTRIYDVVVTALLSLFLAVVCLSVGGQVPAAPGDVLQSGEQTRHAVGPVGAVLGRSAAWALGPWLRWLLVALPWIWIPFVRGRHRGRSLARLGWAAAALLAVTGLLAHPALGRAGLGAHQGGALGDLVHGGLASLLGSLGSFLLLAGLVAFLALRHLPPLHVPLPALDGVLDRLQGPLEFLRRAAGRGGEGLREVLRPARWKALLERLRPGRDDAAETPRVIHREIVAGEDEPLSRARPEPEPTVLEAEVAQAELLLPEGGDGEFRMSRDPAELLAEQEARAPRRRRRRGEAPLPKLDLLEPIAKEERGFSREVLQMNARLLMETLANYGIDGQINEIRPGPVVTTFEFEPAAGVKVSQITSRADDLALAMRATRIRIEAPIPGKAAVGIEIPNPYPQTVGLREVVAALGAEDADSPLAIALGKDTEGQPSVADIAEMPHLLVAGATGSGKSVCINAIIGNLLLRNGPERVRMLMVDPKMLELSVYNGIPHLMHPVITQPREALKAVKWLVAEMTTRYSKLAKQGVRNIADFNDKVKAGKVKDAEGEVMRDPLPYVVFIIDELADLMMQLGSELELPIARLAQMARAVGIHLILATQRPSVNVITGVIKANFPSRIAFRVISKIDSRTILDTGGAEQLLGKGDMLLLLAGMPQPVRVHGAYISMDECERIVEHWKEHAEEESTLDLDGANGGTGIDLGEDELLEEARKLVVATQSGSTTMLQRRLRVGYTRASRLMDMLEDAGVVGPFEGSKARKVLVERGEMEEQQ